MASDKQLRKLIRMMQAKIITRLEKELKLVCKNHYCNIGLALGMALGTAFETSLGVSLGNIELFYNSVSLYERKSFMLMSGIQNVIKDRYAVDLQYSTLILSGEYDIELAKDMAKEWHTTIDRSEYTMIENVGHCANMDQALDFNKIVKAFIENNN